MGLLGNSPQLRALTRSDSGNRLVALRPVRRTAHLLAEFAFEGRVGEEEVTEFLRSSNLKYAQAEIFDRRLFQVPEDQQTPGQRWLFNTVAIEEDLITRRRQQREYAEQLQEIERQERQANRAKQEQLARKLELETKRSRIGSYDQAEDRVLVQFREPMGKIRTKYFRRSQKLEILFEYVESSEDIEFEDSRRKFQLLQMHPTRALVRDSGVPLGEAFGPDCECEKLVIRES